MAALAMAGRLASCQSCVEHFYYQSWRNAVAFLDSCAEGGLVEKVSLLDLQGEGSARPFHKLWQHWYDQAIYISAPVFRKQNLDAARDRVEGTKNAVYNAFHLYHEVLGADDKGIHAAYMAAVEKSRLRHSDIARQRLDVDLSPVAKLRLIQDGYRKQIKDEHPELLRGEVEKRAIELTSKYVLGFSGEDVAPTHVSDHSEELKAFVVEFLADQRDLAEFWRERYAIPSDYRLRLLPVIRELVRHLYVTLRKQDDDAARGFIAGIQEEIDQAKQRAAGDKSYVTALSELREDFDGYLFDGRTPMLVPTADQPGIELRSE
jgi:hypothetical protein